MALSLAKIREQLQNQENRQKQSGSSDTTLYPHWDIAEGTTAKLRFLPDADASNPFFWVERAMIRLPFKGVIGQDTTKQVIVQVPCVEMYGKGNVCPILSEVRPWFNNPELEPRAREYWKKKSYVFQGFVRENPLSEDNAPTNPIRRFVISPQIYSIIKAALLDPEMESLPTDYDSGLDFIVAKTSKGAYADYATSKWSRRESALSQAELDAIEEHGLFNLADFLPKKPNEVELKVIREMFEASVNGEPYDPIAWGEYYRPYGLNIPAGNSQTQTSDTSTPAASVKTVKTPPVVEDDDDDSDDDVVQHESAPAKKADDILAMLRARKSAS